MRGRGRGDRRGETGEGRVVLFLDPAVTRNRV